MHVYGATMSEVLIRPQEKTNPPDSEVLLPSAVDAEMKAVPAQEPLVHPGVAKSYIAIHAVAFAALFLTFSVDGEALFMVAISAFYFLMYVGTPYAMARIGKKRLDTKSSWSKFLEEPHNTFTGPITGREAWIQICLVPLAMTVALVAICAIIVAVRSG